MFSFKLQWNLSTFQAAVNRSCLMSIFRGWVLCTVGGKAELSGNNFLLLRCSVSSAQIQLAFHETMSATEAKHQRLMPGTIQTTSVLMLWCSDLKKFFCVCQFLVFFFSFFLLKENYWKRSENHCNPYFLFLCCELVPISNILRKKWMNVLHWSLILWMST